ncbi:ABC transporter ATP-binding protein [Roseovarius sp. LXJ103]|uniref:dipeptide ABC transporter ATP-binding protein n=1 Tax=Roseovarius carneus TaxID=2853164 RepID=UPI000D606D05|nr:ABC transporter ATP-binding protein [Roseovarius carneus]MBZ8119662.1 ABC transporter ATP-binding protein [Roseovarius carneus]PWE34723.1 glutathione ABC transporter ATP-binding protein GsiA [Pelagicola sp. LXJ1103]
MPDQALLTLRDLSLRYGAGLHVLRGVSLEIGAGEMLSLIGPSGAGKSALSRAILRLDETRGAQVTAGRALWDGRDIAEMSAADLRVLRGGDVGMVFQDASAALNPVLRIGAQIREALHLHGGLRGRAAQTRAESLLAECQVPDPKVIMAQYPHQLSGGLRQRVMIAIALAGAPRLLIADEPTSALDASLRAALLALLGRLRREKGLALLFVTHDMAAAQRMGGNVAVLDAGRVVETGPVDTVLARPAHAKTRALVDAMPGRAYGLGAPPLGAGALSVRGLAVRYPAGTGILHGGMGGRRCLWAAHDVSFDIARGETLALVGESGSGKSSVARAILRLGPVSGGCVELEGRDILGLGARALHTARAQMQMVFQDPMGSLDPRRTLAAQVAEPLQNYGHLADNATIASLFAQVDLPPDLMARYPHQASGGQRQRVAIARALALEPALIVADEAVSALDTHVQGEVLHLMQRLQKRLGLAYLFISHDLAVVSQIAHRIAVMTEGRIVEIGPAERVLNAPQHAYTKRLLAASALDATPAPPGSAPTLPRGQSPAAPVYKQPAPGHLVATD